MGKRIRTVLVAARLPVKFVRALRAQAKRERGTMTAILIRGIRALPEFSEKFERKVLHKVEIRK